MSRQYQNQHDATDQDYTCSIRNQNPTQFQSNTLFQELLQQNTCQSDNVYGPPPSIWAAGNLVGDNLLRQAHQATDNVTTLILSTAVAVYSDSPEADDFQAELSIYKAFAELIESEIGRIEILASEQFEQAWQQCGESAYDMFPNAQLTAWLTERIDLLEDMTQYIKARSIIVGQQFLPAGKRLMELVLQFQKSKIEVDVEQLGNLETSLSQLLKNKDTILNQMDTNIKLAQAQLVFDTIATIVGFCGGVGPVLTVLTGLTSAGFGYLYEDSSALTKVNTLVGTGASLLAQQHDLAKALPKTQDLFGTLRNNFPKANAIGNSASVLGVGYDVIGLAQLNEDRNSLLNTLERAPDMIDQCLSDLLKKEGTLNIISEFLSLVQSTSVLEIISKARDDAQRHAYTMRASNSCFEAAPIL